MPTKKKQKPKSQAPAALLAGGAAASVAAGEAGGHHYRGKALDAEDLMRAARRRASGAGSFGGGVGSVTSTGYTADPKLSPTEHAKLADEYQEWAGRRGTRYPYMNPRANKEASERAYEHRVAARGRAGAGPRPGGPRPGGRTNFNFEETFGDAFRDWARGEHTARDRANWEQNHHSATAARAASKARVMRRYESESRQLGRIGGGVLAAGALGVGLHTWQENKHRRDHGKFATTGVKKSMDDVSKDFREQLHRRAQDGRFQAGAAGAAGVAGAGFALKNTGAGHHRAEARALNYQAVGHVDYAEAARKKANELAGRATRKDGKPRKMYSGGKADLKEAQRLHGIADDKFNQAKLKQALSGERMTAAETAARRGKYAATAALGAGALGAGAALVNRHRQQKLVSDLEGTAVEKNLSAEEYFSKARENVSKLQPETKRGLKQGTVIGGVIGGGLGAAHAAANSHMGPKWGATAVGLNAAAGAGVGAAIGSSAGAERANRRIDTENAIRNVQRRRSVKKNLEEISVEELFGKARELDELEKGLWTAAGEAAGAIGRQSKTGFNAAGEAGAKFGGKVKAGATGGFNAAKPKIKAAGTGLKNQWAGQSQARKYTAVGAAGAAGGIGLGAAAQSHRNRPVY